MHCTAGSGFQPPDGPWTISHGVTPDDVIRPRGMRTRLTATGKRPRRRGRGHDNRVMLPRRPPAVPVPSGRTSCAAGTLVHGTCRLAGMD
jgi:hypothetical protein